MNTRDLKEKTLDDLLYYAAQEASKEMIDEISVPENVEFSAEHQKKMKVLFAACRRKEKMKKMGKYAKRAAIILGIFITISAVSIVSVQAWRIKFMNFVMDLTQSNTEIRYEENEGNGDSYSTDKVSLEYIPDGFSLEESISNSAKVHLKFKKDELVFSLRIRRIDFISNVDTENASAQKIRIGGKETFMIEKDGTISLNWNGEEKAYTLVGNLSKEEMVKIAENIK